MLRLWLDDDDARVVPSGFDLRVRTAPEAIEAIKSGQVSEVSLDHDLGLSASDDVDPGTGYDVAVWIEQQAYLGNIPRLRWSIHSANPVGAVRMRQALNNADRYWSAHERKLSKSDVVSGRYKLPNC